MNKPIEYPALVWVETKSGNIAPVYVLRSKNDYTEHFWKNSVTRTDDKFSKVGDVYRFSPGSQAESQLYFLENVTEEQIKDLLARASRNKSK